MPQRHSIIWLTLVCLSLSNCWGCQSFVDNSEVIRVDASSVVCGTPQELTRAGVAAMTQCDYALAETSFKQAIQLDETYAPAYNNLGRIYFQRGDNKRATAAFARAMELMPGRPEPVNNIGLVYESAGMLGKAIDFYWQARELSPDNVEYMANSLRARIRRGDRGAEIQADLQALRLIEHRPEWTAWVDDNLALLPGASRADVGLDSPFAGTPTPKDFIPTVESGSFDLTSPNNQIQQDRDSILFAD